LHDSDNLEECIIPIEDVLEYPYIKVAKEFSPYIINGRSPAAVDIVDVGGDFDADDIISLKDHENRIMAVGKSTIKSSKISENSGRNIFSYIRVLN
jgi:predicted ribosome-associated RNA-binding protein Tma20